MEQPVAQQLPLADNGLAQGKKRTRSWASLRLVPLLILVFFAGGVTGLYFQPPGLQAFFETTGLEPGGGTQTPIAQAITQVETRAEVAVVSDGDIFALGRILPRGDVIEVAVPFGAGDARINRIAVEAGDRVAAGDVLATLDNADQLQLALDAAPADLAVKQAILTQTENSVSASRQEALAALERAVATAEAATAELDRLTPLFERGVTTRSAFEAAVARASEADRDVASREATLTRFQSTEERPQADILVAQANLRAAEVRVAVAQNDLAMSIVAAPVDGVVLDINVRLGERPGAEGVMDVGDTSQMIVEAEVYQTLIGQVAIGDAVTVTADAIDEPLQGVVTAIGLEIGRQSITSDDPAANTDARVVDVIIELDPPSSALAERLTNLQALVRIDVGADG